MKKYYIRYPRNFGNEYDLRYVDGVRRRPVDYTVDDLEKFSMNRTAYYHEPIAKFDTMEEAKAEFEKEKQYCTTRATDGYTFPLILFDELQLVEVEYDEDGEFLSSEVWDSYIANDDCLTF